LATTEFVFNNKVYISIKLLSFKVNSGKEPRMGFKIRKKKACKSRRVCKRNEGNA